MEYVKIAPREVYGKTLLELGKERNDIVVLDADLSKSTKTYMFAKEFPNRFFDAGISEQNMVGVAGGIASMGFCVFASSFAIFLTGRAWEQIRNTIVHNNLNVKLVATHAGITVGKDGATHQAIEDIALMRSIPGMRVIVPGDPIETAKAIRFVAGEYGPFYIRLGRGKLPQIYDSSYKFEFGRGVILQEGSDVCIIATGFMVHKAIEAAHILGKKGVSCRVVNIHTIKPIDKELIIDISKKFKHIVVCEEHNMYGGLFGAVSEVIAKERGTIIVAIQDTFGQSGSEDDLVNYYHLDSQYIAFEIEKRMQ